MGAEEAKSYNLIDAIMEQRVMGNTNTTQLAKE
jgi:hypothetical protein